MPFEFWYTLLLLLALTVLLAGEWVEADVAMFSALVLLVAANVINVEEAFSGFSNEGMLTIAFLYVIAGGLSHTGITNQISHIFFGVNKSSVTRKLLRVLFPISTVSAFMNNTPLVAMLIPMVRSWTDKNNYSPSKFLIPVSFAAILGGLCTLIGSSINLIVHGMMIDHGMPGLGFFEITPIGLPLALASLLFISFVGHRLLPERKEPLIELGEKTRKFVIELKITSAYEHIGKTVENAGLRHLKGLFLFQIERDGQVLAPARPDHKLRLHDRLFFTGLPKTIIELQRTPGLQLLKDATFDLKQYNSAHVKAFEAVISASSPLIGKTVRGSDFREKYEAVIIAIHRSGERIKRKIGDITLKHGDTLLLLAGKNFRRKWYHSNDFHLISASEHVPSKPKWQGYFCLTVFISMIAVNAAGVMPLISAAALAGVIIVGTRCITPSEVGRMIDWRILIMIASALGIAQALENSGLADFFATVVVDWGRNFGIIGVLAGVYLVTNIYSTFITSNATAALFFPVAILAAASMHADPRPFAITVIVASAGSFMTPISYQTNLMVYGPGGYKFKDFVKIGLPLQLLVATLAIFLIYLYYC